MAAILAIGMVYVMVFSSIPIQVHAQGGGLFEITLVAPGTANQARRQWAQIVRNTMQQVGIDAKVVYLGWGAVFDRILFAPKEIWGKTYVEGGYDALFIGYGWTSPVPIANLFTQYGKGTGAEAEKFFPPGPNWYYYEDTKYSEMIEKYLRALPAGMTPERIQLLKDMQAYMQTNAPDNIIFYDRTVFATAPSIGNFNPLVPYQPQWLKGPKTATVAVPGEWTAFNPVLSNSWYDIPYINAMFDGGIQQDYSGAFVPVDLIEYPIKSSADGLTWTLKLRPGVMWHDGVEVTADDYVFSKWIQYTPETGSQALGYNTEVFGSKITLQYLNGTSITIDKTAEGSTPTVGSIVAKDKYTVEVKIPQVYAIFDPESIFGPMPKHVLEKIPPAEWSTHSFNTGEGSYTITKPDGSTVEWTGPVGNGAYQFVGYDRVRQIVTVKKFSGYWNKTALEAAGLFTIETWNTQFITEKEAALAALKNGEVQLLDFNYHFEKDVKRFDPAWGVTTVFDAYGLQEFGVNMRHPVWGTGVDTPLGKKDPSKAKEAAWHVRRAFDNLIPRQLIIDNLMDGYPRPGITFVLPPQIGFNTELKPTPYDIEEAKKHLAAAGYDVAGFQPATLTASAGLLDVNLQGKFVNASSGKPFAFPLRIDIQMSTDGGATWTTLQQVFTEADGTFKSTVSAQGPANVWFRAYYPGNTIPVDKWIEIIGKKTGEVYPLELTQLVPPLTTKPAQVFVLGPYGVALVVILLIAIVGGAGFYFARRRKAKPKA